jgi:hypothetical protein
MRREGCVGASTHGTHGTRVRAWGACSQESSEQRERGGLGWYVATNVCEQHDERRLAQVR